MLTKVRIQVICDTCSYATTYREENGMVRLKCNKHKDYVFNSYKCGQWEYKEDNNGNA